MFSYLKEKFFGFYNNFSNKIASIFQGQQIGQEQIDELFELLVSCDVGSKLAKELIEKVKTNIKESGGTDSNQIFETLKNNLHQILDQVEADKTDQEIIILLGINGAGKTTTCAKLAQKLKDDGEKVLLVAADTFRAAAQDQLEAWTKKIGVDVVLGEPNQDPTSVVFQGCQKFKSGQYTKMIVDTAGRLHTKINLVKELEKLYKSIKKNCPESSFATWIVLDSMLGQTSLNQTRVFYEAAEVNGAILTKFDGTGKGGVVFAIAEEFKIPVTYLTFGEDLKSIEKFDKTQFIEKMFKK